jgi:hypothetical protein
MRAHWVEAFELLCMRIHAWMVLTAEIILRLKSSGGRNEQVPEEIPVADLI